MSEVIALTVVNVIPQAFQGCVVTIIIVGHLVIQVLTTHVLAMFATDRVFQQTQAISLRMPRHEVMSEMAMLRHSTCLLVHKKRLGLWWQPDSRSSVQRCDRCE